MREGGESERARGGEFGRGKEVCEKENRSHNFCPPISFSLSLTLMISMVAIARPAPFTMHPILPARYVSAALVHNTPHINFSIYHSINEADSRKLGGFYEWSTKRKTKSGRQTVAKCR